MSRMALFAAVAAAITAIAVIATASAQYPAPKGSLFCVIARSSSLTDGQAQISATLKGTSGVSIAGQSVSFRVMGDAASTAALSTPSSLTDASGTAYTTLFAGTRPGRITVSATNDGLECRVVLDVLAPISEVQGIRPPTTGDGGLADVALLGDAALFEGGIVDEVKNFIHAAGAAIALVFVASVILLAMLQGIAGRRSDDVVLVRRE